MMFYEKNLRCLKERYGDVYEHCLKTLPSGDVEVFLSQSKLPTFRLKGKLFHSSYNPMKEAEMFLKDKDLRYTQLVIVLGFGFGYHLRRFLSDPFFQGNVIAIEPQPEVFREALKNVDLESLIANHRLSIIVEDQPKIAKQKLQKILEKAPLKRPAIRIITHPVSLEFNISYYLEILDQIRYYLKVVIANLSTARFFRHIWQRNAIRLLPEIANSPNVKGLFNRFEGRTGIIVSAGPSLDRNIEELRRLENRAIILCVGTAYRTLFKAKIVPHFVVVIDAHSKVVQQFKGIKSDKKTYLLTEDTVSLQIVNLFRERRFFFSSSPPNFFVRYFLPDYKVEIISVGGTVAHAAVDIAVKMGLNPIILVGQDLSFSSDGRTHATGSMYEKNRINLSEAEKQGYFYVPGNFEEKVLTNTSFYIFLRWLENYIQTHPAITFINSTSEGAKIEGVKLIPLGEAINLYCNHSFDIEQQTKEAFQQRDFQFDLPSFLQHIEEGLLELGEIEEDFKEGLNLTCKIKSYLKKDPLRFKEKIEKIAQLLLDLDKRLQAKKKIADLFWYGIDFLNCALEIVEDRALRDEDFQKVFLEGIDRIYRELLRVSRRIQKQLRLLKESVSKSISLRR